MTTHTHTPPNKLLFVCLFCLEICVGFPVSGIYLFPLAQLVMILSFYALYLTHCVGLRLWNFFFFFFWSSSAPHPLCSICLITGCFLQQLDLQLTSKLLYSARILWCITHTDVKCYFTPFPRMPKFSSKGQKGIQRI